jgi:hypothetical protein
MDVRTLSFAVNFASDLFLWRPKEPDDHSTAPRQEDQSPTGSFTTEEKCLRKCIIKKDSICHPYNQSNEPKLAEQKPQGPAMISEFSPNQINSEEKQEITDSDDHSNIIPQHIHTNLH